MVLPFLLPLKNILHGLLSWSKIKENGRNAMSSFNESS